MDTHTWLVCGVCVVCVFTLVCTLAFLICILPAAPLESALAGKCHSHTLYSSVFGMLSYFGSLSCCSRLCEPLWPATRPSSFGPCQVLQAPVNPEPSFGAKYLTCQKPFLLLPFNIPLLPAQTGTRFLGVMSLFTLGLIRSWRLKYPKSAPLIFMIGKFSVFWGGLCRWLSCTSHIWWFFHPNNI